MFARMTSKGQVTIPREIRQRFNLKKGSLLTFAIKEDRAELAVVEDDILALKGSVRVKKAQDFKAVRTEIERRIAQDVTREA